MGLTFREAQAGFDEGALNEFQTGSAVAMDTNAFGEGFRLVWQ